MDAYRAFKSDANGNPTEIAFEVSTIGQYTNYEIVQTADAAQQHAMDVSKDCLMDGTQPCTPASFDYEHYSYI